MLTNDEQALLKEIFEDWANSERRFPEKALKTAMNQRELITPVLLKEIKELAREPEYLANAGDYWVSLYALYILAAFRDIRILPHVEALCEHGDSFYRLWCDEAGEDGRRLFASWAFSNPDSLKKIVENRKCEEFVRTDALQAFVILHYNGVVTEDALKTYLQYLGENFFKREPSNSESVLHTHHTVDSWAWYIWSDCCFQLGFDDLYSLAKIAYDERWIDPTIATWSSTARDRADDVEETPGHNSDRLDVLELIDDPVEELRDWYCFTPEARRLFRQQEREEAQTIPASKVEPWRHPDTIVNDAPKPKPNQPCSCGSGKKFKKCCGRR